MLNIYGFSIRQWQHLFLGFLLCFLSATEQAQGNSDDQKIWSNALAEFDAGQFEKSIQLFEKLVAENPDRGHIYYNLGNAYYKSSNRGAALASYFAARQFLPRDPDLKSNISYLERSNTDSLSSETDYSWAGYLFFWLPKASSYEIGLLASLIFSLGVVLISLSLLGAKSKPILRQFGAFLVIFGVIFGVSYFAKIRITPTWGAVTAAEASVYSDRNTGAQLVFKLKEGAPVKVMEESLDKSWVKIEISDGKQGFLAQSELKYYHLSRQQ